MTACPPPSPLCYGVDDWMNNWNGESSYCVQAVNCYLFDSVNSFPSITEGTLVPAELYRNFGAGSTAVQFVQSAFMNPMFEAFNRDGYRIGSNPSEGTYSSFQNTLFAFCSSVPGMCRDYLASICSSETEESLVNNPYLSQWCGCYLSPESYKRYDSAGILPQCTPTCAREGVIPRVQNRNYTFPITCQNNVCLMNNITIGLNDTQLTKGISFSQYCTGCGKEGQGRCSCIIEDVTIDVMSRSLDNIDLRQSCGNTSCQKSINGKLVDVNCVTGLPIVPLKPTNQLLTVGIVVIIAIIVIIFFWLLRSSSTKKDNSTRG